MSFDDLGTIRRAQSQLKESHLILKDIPTGGKSGLETICVFSPNSEYCKDIPRQTIQFQVKGANGELICHGNSALLSLKLTIKEVVERFIFERIRTELIRRPSSQIKLLRDPEEGFDITFFLDVSMVQTLEQRRDIVQYINNFPEKMRGATTRGKMSINDFVRKQAEDFKLG